MGNINANVTDSQVSGSYNTTDTTETTGTGKTIGQGTKDTTGVTETYPETTVPQNTGNPQLNTPNYTLINAPPSTQQTDPTIIEQNIKQLVETNADLADAINTILNRKGITTEDGKNELLASLAQQAADSGGDDRAIQEAIASQLQGIINTSSPQDAAKLQPLMNHLRISLFSQDEPDTKLLVLILKQQLINQGTSPDDAEQLAEQEALSMLDDYLSQNGVATPLLGKNPLEGAALQQALLNSLPPDLQGIEGEGLVGGVSLFSDIEQMASQYFTTISNITESPGTEGVNLQTRLTQASQGADALQEMIKSMLDSIDSKMLPLSNPNQIELKEYLKFLDETIKKLKDLLNQIAILDAQKSQKLSQAELELADNRCKVEMANLQNKLDQYIKQKETSKWAKIGTYIAGALLAIFGALLAPFTGGLSLAFAIGFSIAMFATTVALTETGVMNKAFTELGNALDKAVQQMSPGAPQWAKTLFKTLVYTAILVASVILTKGVSTALKAISPMAQVLAVQAAVTITTEVVASSGVVNDIVQLTVARIPGISKEAIAWISAALLILVMMSVSIGGAIAVNKIAQNITDSAEKFGKDIFDKLIKLGIDPKNLDVEDCIKAASRLRSVGAYISVGASALQAGPAIATGIADLQVGDLEKKSSEYEALLTTMNALIKLLQKTIDMLQGDASNTMEDAARLTDLFDNAVSGLRDDITNLFNAA